MRIIGIDLAWQTEKNSSALAVGRLDRQQLHIESLVNTITGVDNILHFIEQQQDVAGISIDAPLIINNDNGQRQCERDLNKRYRRYKAGCHSSNLALYPDAGSVRLAERLAKKGFRHLGDPVKQKWQIECFPHPALVELFQLDERLLYKKGKVEHKKQGQIKLANLIRSLTSATPALRLPAQMKPLLEQEAIMANRGRAIKQHEDALDALICAYIGACYANGVSAAVFGDTKDGYVYVPTMSAR